MENSKRDKLNGLADIFDLLAKLCRSEYCDSLDESVIDTVSVTAKKALNVNVSYKTIQQVTGMGYNAIATAAHRDGIKAEVSKSFPFSWVLKRFKKKF